MAVPVIQPSFATGEVTPSLFGRVDISREHSAAATMRNLFVSYRGGAYSRAGTSFVGFSRQMGRAYPPRLIPFQFSINQGLVLEFGNFYMRVISNGAYVTGTPYLINNVTNGNPAVVTVTAPSSAAAATANIGGVTVSYAPADTITVAGGVFTAPAVLAVSTTQLASVALNANGTSNYRPNDTVTLAGGAGSPAIVTVAKSRVVAVTSIVSGGTGGTPGTQTLTGTTGTGTKFQVSATVTAGGVVSAILGITNPGSYTVAPSINPETMAGPGFTVAPTLNITLGIDAITLTNGGIYTANAPGGTFTQASSSGTGTGATFQSGLFAPYALTVQTPGAYSTTPANPAAQASTSGSGAGATFNITWSAPAAPNNGDWVYITGVGGMPAINNTEYLIAGVSVAGSTATFGLLDMYGNSVDATAFGTYTGGGTAAGIFTASSPYAEADLRWIKYTQSADVMSLCCVNQNTNTEYLPYDLTRISDTSWGFIPVIPSAVATPPPGGVTVTIAGGTGTINYSYVVTAVAADGTESIASAIGSASGGNIAASAGTVTIAWTAVPNVSLYYVYKAIPDASTTPPAGVPFGFIGQAYGTQFVDGNIVPDLVQVPPTHENPFARGAITAVNVTGSTGTVTTATATITTATGSGAVLQTVIVGSSLAAVIVLDGGSGYLPTDFVTINVTGGGSATAQLVVGPETGTYPSVPAYFQERRVYADTLNEPDTYFMSQPGSFTNFDQRTPTLDTDAIIGSPWSQEVNGIQFMLPMPGGLVVLTGLSAWLVNGGGGSALNVQPITPSSQQAVPQTYNGCSPLLPPVKIDYDVVYLQSKGSIYRRFNYNIYANIYTGEDITIASSHLFTDHQMVDHAWCEEPNKVMWVVRDDGIMLSSTILKTQEILGWSRHDTDGLYQACCSVTEPPVDALYVAVQRFLPLGTSYTIERMDNRIWPAAEDCWCVDCGLQLGQPAPPFALVPLSATGQGACTGVTNLVGGKGYSAGTTATVVDTDAYGNPGPGTGASAVLVITGGVITTIGLVAGSGYVNPKLVITDPAGSSGGSGASATITLSNVAQFNAFGSIFSPASVGSIIRAGGGIARVVSFVNANVVFADILQPIVDVIPGTSTPVVQPAGSWTLTPPATTIYGLRHLSGATVTGLADGNVVSGLVVSPSGTVTLPTPASAVTLGLGFTAQLQSVYLDSGEPTVQGQRKKIAAVTARIEASRGVMAGSSQPDASVQSPVPILVPWPTSGASTLETVPDDGPNFAAKLPKALCEPLRTGDIRVSVKGGFTTRGQVAIQQTNPLPLQCLAFISEVMAGDIPQGSFPKRQGGK